MLVADWAGSLLVTVCAVGVSVFSELLEGQVGLVVGLNVGNPFGPPDGSSILLRELKGHVGVFVGAKSVGT